MKQQRVVGELGPMEAERAGGSSGKGFHKQEQEQEQDSINVAMYSISINNGLLLDSIRTDPNETRESKTSHRYQRFIQLCDVRTPGSCLARPKDEAS